MTIGLSTDHAGFVRLKRLKAGLELLGYQCIDFGPESYQADDDYPDYIKPVAVAVQRGECEVGIIFGGSGQGEAMVANRFQGVRCTVWYGPAVAVEAVNAEGQYSSDPYELLRLSKEHNNANMLSIAGRFVSDAETIKAVVLWLNHQFTNEARHQRRIEKMDVV